MHECLTTLQTIALSTEELLADRYSSLHSAEIKHSAGVLRASIEPCLEEIQKSTALLKTHLESCLQRLDTAEDLWQSKQQIAEVQTASIWQDIGEISGCWIRVQELATELKLQVSEQVKQIWLTQIKEIKEQWFWDSKNNRYKSGIGWGDKDGFLRELPKTIHSLSSNMAEAMQNALQKILKEMGDSHVERIQELISVYDSEAILKLRRQHKKQLLDLYLSFQQPIWKLKTGSNSLDWYENTYSVTKEWQKRFGDISLQEFEQFRDTVLDKIEKRIEMVIVDRLSTLQEAVECAIAFYNQFLEKQTCYRQETPEQRKAEKAWIDLQRKQLQHLLTSLETTILKIG